MFKVETNVGAHSYCPWPRDRVSGTVERASPSVSVGLFRRDRLPLFCFQENEGAEDRCASLHALQGHNSPARTQETDTVVAHIEGCDGRGVGRQGGLLMGALCTFTHRAKCELETLIDTQKRSVKFSRS